MISAPDATEPTMVTSPSGKMIDWPERTGLSSSSEAGVGFAGGPAGAAGGTDFLSPAGRRLLDLAGVAAADHRRRQAEAEERRLGALDAHDADAAPVQLGDEMAELALELRQRRNVEDDRPPGKEARRARHQRVEVLEPLRDRPLGREHERHEGAASEPDRAGLAGGVWHGSG